MTLNVSLENKEDINYKAYNWNVSWWWK